MRVMQDSEQRRPALRRLGDTPGRLVHAAGGDDRRRRLAVGGDPVRFLAVLVVATPCPLLIAIPVAIIGAISLAATRSIVIRDPAVLETIDRCRTMVFDKTGTLTYGQPTLTDRVTAPGFDADEVLRLAASLERYSKHPLAAADARGRGPRAGGARRRRRAARAARAGPARAWSTARRCASWDAGRPRRPAWAPPCRRSPRPRMHRARSTARSPPPTGSATRHGPTVAPSSRHLAPRHQLRTA